MLKDLLKDLETAEKESDRLDALYTADPENEEIELAWNKAYAAQTKALRAVRDYIISLIGISESTAIKMIMFHREELKSISLKEA